jgi:hypothetical protein
MKLFSTTYIKQTEPEIKFSFLANALLTNIPALGLQYLLFTISFLADGNTDTDTKIKLNS